MTSATGVQGITEADIADYLANTPAFFERHAELLAAVQLTSPHGQRAISLQERQMEMLREKIKGLEHKIIEMIRIGQDNTLIAAKLQRWTCALMLTAQPAGIVEVLLRELQQPFMIPQAALRVWGAAAQHAAQPCAQPVSQDLRSFADSLERPSCGAISSGANSGHEAAQWLPDPGNAVSMALIPLRNAEAPHAFGLLVLASPDPTRYAADMGTDFLVSIGEIASAALSRLLPAAG